MSESLKMAIKKNGYSNGYIKYIKDHPSSIKRINENIEKYGFEKGIDKTIEENTKRCSNSKDKFIKLYGEEEGNKRWNDFLSNIKKNHHSKKTQRPSLERYIEKYGEIDGKIFWEQYKKSLSFTKESCIEKYGEKDGIKKWDEYIKKMSESCKMGTSSEQMKYINSLGFYIEKYGEKEGNERYAKWKKSQDHSSKKFMIEKYGVEMGLEKYKEVGFKRAFHSDSYHSKISQELFDDIKNILNTDECMYSKNGGEFRLFDKENNKPYYFDFRYKNKIIEYNGDYWHANPKIYDKDYEYKNGIRASDIWKKDNSKQLLAEQMGFSVLTIWDSDYKCDRTATLKKCLQFLEY